MNAAGRAPYLEAGDTALEPLGFKRKKKEYAWQRMVGQDVERLHINFGLDVINPSYDVGYTDVEALYPSNLGVKCGPFCLLQNLTGTSYSASSTSPSVVSGDLLKAVGEFPTLRDREAFAAMLMSDARPRIYVILKSHRMREIPALLASFGRVNEALAWLARFEETAPKIDQMLPSYEVFAAQFRSMYPAPST